MVVDLKESRKKIDNIDKEIAKLFEERMKVATDVAAYKRSTGKKVFDPVREEEKIKTLRELTTDEFNKTGIEDLFRQIMSISRKYQYKVLGSETNELLPFKQVDKLDVDKDTRIVCFGEHGAYTEQAMEEVFGTDITSMNRLSFKEVLETVANGEAKYGVIPIENTSTGGINDTYDLLLDYDITIVAEHVVKVEQALLGKPGAKISDIKKVYSHPQGIMQCSKFITEQGMLCAAGAAEGRSGAAFDGWKAAALHRQELWDRHCRSASSAVLRPSGLLSDTAETDAADDPGDGPCRLWRWRPFSGCTGSAGSCPSELPKAAVSGGRSLAAPSPGGSERALSARSPCGDGTLPG